MLKVGQSAIDFPVGARTLFALLLDGPAVVFFFPSAFTSG
jgi:peroxiredoxin